MGGGAVDPGDVLAQLLESLDVEPAFVAAQFKARCTQYWSKTADARLILIVDNARYASEIVPLLPASGASLVIVTSHSPLRDLEDGAALGISVPPLEEWAATELLQLLVRDPQAGGRPGVRPHTGAVVRRHAGGPPCRRRVGAPTPAATPPVPSRSAVAERMGGKGHSWSGTVLGHGL